jgi:hypothetical protein
VLDEVDRARADEVWCLGPPPSSHQVADGLTPHPSRSLALVAIGQCEALSDDEPALNKPSLPTAQLRAGLGNRGLPRSREFSRLVVGRLTAELPHLPS